MTPANSSNGQPARRKPNNKPTSQKGVAAGNKKGNNKSFNKNKKNKFKKPNNPYNKQPAVPNDSVSTGNIVTKRPVWGDAPSPNENGSTPQKDGNAQKKDNNATRNNRNRGGKKRNKNNYQNKQHVTAKQEKEKKPAPIPQNENGIFDFSEAELAEDQALQVISRTNSETKYASFEDFLKDH